VKLVLCFYLGINGCSKDIPFCRREGSPECSYVLQGVNIMLHDAIISKIGQKELECTAMIRCAGIKKRSVIILGIVNME
jgi:hypothetical protein